MMCGSAAGWVVALACLYLFLNIVRHVSGPGLFFYPISIIFTVVAVHRFKDGTLCISRHTSPRDVIAMIIRWPSVGHTQMTESF